MILQGKNQTLRRNLHLGYRQLLIETKNKDFFNKNNYIEKMIYKDSFRFDKGNEEVYKESKDNNKIYKIFIQFLHFKKMMNIFEKYEF